MAAFTLAALLPMLLPLLTAGGAGLGSFFASKGKQKGNDQLPQGSTISNTPDGMLRQFSDKTPGQQDLQSQLMSLLQGQLSGPNSIEEESRRKFSEEGLPALLSRFASNGNSLMGSGIQNAILRAQSGLESNIAAQKYGALQNLMGPALSGGLQQEFTPNEPGAFQSFMSGAAPAFGQSLGSAMPDLLKGLQGLGSSQQAKGFIGSGGQQSPGLDLSSQSQQASSLMALLPQLLQGNK